MANYTPNPEKVQNHLINKIALLELKNAQLEAIISDYEDGKFNNHTDSPNNEPIEGEVVDK